MRRWWLAAFAGAVLAGAMVMPGTLGAQMQAEVRGGLTVGSHSASAAALDIAPAVSFDVVLKRQVTPSIAAFGGFFRTAFGCEEGFCKDRNLTVVGNHGALGGEWGGADAWLRAGVLFGSTRVGTEGEPAELGLGAHAAAGLNIGIGRLRFLPGVSYRWMSAATASSTDHAIALALDLGFGVQLGGGGS